MLWRQRSYGLMTANLFSGALLVLSALYFTVPIIHVLSEEFNVSTSTAAWSGTAFSGFFAVGCLIYGPLSSRIGRKRVMVAGLIGLALATLGTFVTDSFAWLVLLRCLQGATASTFSPVALTYAGEMFPPSKRVTVIGFISTGFLMSGIFGQVAASLLTYWSGWNSLFLVFGCLYALLAVCFIYFLPEAPKMFSTSKVLNASKAPNTPKKFDSSQKSQASIEAQQTPGQSLLNNRSLLLCYVVTITVLLCFVGTYSALEFHLSAPPFSLTFSAILTIRAVGILGMILCPFAGRLCRRYSMPVVLRTGLAIAMLSLLLLGFVQQMLIYAIVSVIFVAGIALIVPSLIALIGELGGSRRALATSLYTFILFIGASLGPIVAIAVIEQHWTISVYHIFAALFFISFICAIYVKQPAVAPSSQSEQ